MISLCLFVLLTIVEVLDVRHIGREVDYALVGKIVGISCSGRDVICVDEVSYVKVI
jgi:hypothetical protein